MLTTLGELNDLNRRFWAAENKLMECRMEERVVLETAIEIDTEAARAPVSFAVALKIASNARRGFTSDQAAKAQVEYASEFARKGGRAKKGDLLNKRMEEIVSQNKKISADKLLNLLKKEQHGEVIDEITDTEIWFVRRDGTSRSVTMPALANRLTRMKKKISLTSKR